MFSSNQHAVSHQKDASPIDFGSDLGHRRTRIIQILLRPQRFIWAFVLCLLSLLPLGLDAQSTEGSDDLVQKALAQLTSHDAELIYKAHERLALIGKVDPTIPKQLAAMMWDEQVNDISQYWALQTLVSIGPAAKDVMPELVRMMEHRDPYFRMRGASAVLQAGGEPIQPIDVLIALASQRSDQSLRGEALLALGQAGPIAKKAIPLLQKIVKESSDELDREWAAQALGGMQVEAKDSIPILAKIIDEESDSLRRAAIRALAELVATCPESLPPLLNEMNNPGYEGHLAAEALISGGSKVVPELVKLLKSDDVIARKRAIHTLRSLGRSAVAAREELAAIIPELTDAELIGEVLETFGNIGPQAVPQLQALLSQETSTELVSIYDICIAIRKIGEPAKTTVPTLIQIMSGNEDESDRNSATDALTAIGPAATESTHLLLDLIGEEAKDADLNAIRVLGAIGPGAKEAVPALIETIEQNRDKNHYRSKMKAWHAAVALCKIGVSDESTVSLLVESLADPSEESSQALGLLGPKAIEALPRLRRLLSSEESRTRIEAALAVSRIDPTDTEIIPVLAKSLTDPQGVYPEGETMHASRVLSAIGERSKSALPALRSLLDYETEVSASAALAIYRIQTGDQQALTSLIVTLESGDSSGLREAIQALGSIGPPAKAALPKLRQIARTNFGYAREAAQIAIRSIDPSTKE